MFVSTSGHGDVKAVTILRCCSGQRDKPTGSSIKIQGDCVIVHSPQSNVKETSYPATKCYSEEIKNERIFNDAGMPLVAKAVDGYNVLFLSVGQPGNGSSRTLCGSIDEEGFIPMFSQRLFSSLEDKHSSNRDYLVTLSYLQISDTTFSDVMNPGDERLEIRSHFRTGVYVSELSEYVVASHEELNKLVNEGHKTRDTLDNVNSNRHQCSSIVKVNVEQKSSDDSLLVSEIIFATIAGSDQVTCRKSFLALDGVVASLSGQSNARTIYTNSKLTHVLQKHLSETCFQLYLGTVSQNDKDYPETENVLELIKKACSIATKPTINKCDNASTIAEIRSDINSLREKIVSKGHNIIDISDGKDLNRLEQLIKDLEYLKLQSWSEKQRLSKSYEKERWQNLANKGLLDFVMNPQRHDSKESQEHLQQLQKDKDQVMVEYKDKRVKVDEIKERLQMLITEYSKLTELGKAGEEESKRKVPEIHTLKESLKLENENLKKLKQKLKDIQEKQKQEQQTITSDLNILQGKPDVKSRLEADHRQQIVKENHETLTKEIERLRIDTEQQKAELKMKYSQGRQLTAEETLQAETSLLDLKAEKLAMALKIKTEQQEKDQLLKDVTTANQRHKEELEIQQLQYFQTFRHYREIFEEQKAALDQQYRALLEDAIHDAVFLSSRNEELMEENHIYQQDLAEAKDRLSVIGSNKT